MADKFNWQHHPAHLVAAFDEGSVPGRPPHTLGLACEHGSVLDALLKDTHTCKGHTTRR